VVQFGIAFRSLPVCEIFLVTLRFIMMVYDDVLWLHWEIYFEVDDDVLWLH
jgi:hypothetical protein